MTLESESTPGHSLRDEVRASDCVAVRDILNATDFFSAVEMEIAVDLVHERLEKGPASGYEFLFADQGGETVGYACYGLIPCTAASYDLYWIGVAPGRQGGGLGQRLLDETEKRVRAAGGTSLYAETSGRSQYAPTRAFYERCGYAIVSVLPEFYGPGDDKVVFVKRLE